ncbi:MAG: ABC transporter permease, partial [Dysgonomonas sp.]
MIKHILKTIWTERKINAWILLELILVFCILWFCADYMLYIGKKYIEPRGFDITHTYKIGINLKEEGRKVANSGTDEEKKQMLDNIWTIYDRVKQYPAVESVSYSSSAAPYSGSWSSGDLTMDSVVVPHQRKTVSPGFFEV